MADINQLLARPQTVDALGQFTRGRAAGQQIQSQNLANQAMQQESAQKQQLNQLLQSGAGTEQLIQSGNVDMANSVLKARAAQSDENKAKFDKGIADMFALTSQIQDPNDTAGLQKAMQIGVSSGLFDAEGAQRGMELGVGNIRSLHSSLTSQSTGNLTVKNAVPLAGGGFRTLMSDGSVRLVKAGDESEKFIQDAEARGVTLQGERAESRKGGSLAAQIESEPELVRKRAQAAAAQDTSEKAFKQVQSIRGNLTNLREAQRLIKEEKANTGAISSKLPSFKASTIRLENMQKNLGLDVIGSVTFGALSQGELDLALSTALPLNLSEEDLIVHIDSKIAAQEKLMDYFEEQAIFLETGTQTQWLERVKAKESGDGSDQAGSEQLSQVMSFDAQGNPI